MAQWDCNFEFARGGVQTAASVVDSRYPMLEPQKNKYHGNTAIGLVFSRYYSPEEEPMANPNSTTRQKQYDLNLVQDRRYEFFSSTNEDGWLCGGGENGDSSKLPAIDSSHITISEPGTMRKEWGGIPLEDIVDLLTSGKIMIPHMATIPSCVAKNGDSPPEVEIKYVLEKDESKPIDEWGNWAIVFLENQLFAAFRDIGSTGVLAWPMRGKVNVHAHISMVRKSGWKSLDHAYRYFEKCNRVCEEWRKMGPQLLTPETDPTKPGYPNPVLGKELEEPYGVYLYRTRSEVTHYFPPNFLPPYNTPEKREIIQKWIDYPDTLNQAGYQQRIRRMSLQGREE